MARSEFLTDAQVEEVARRMLAELGPNVAETYAELGIDAHDIVRLIPLGRRCRDARAHAGLTIRPAAAQLKVPQYRLRDVEAGRADRVEPTALVRYVAMLRLEAWFGRWKRHNRDLTRRLSPAPARTARTGAAGPRGPGRMLRFHVVLHDIEPPIWRRIAVPDDYTFWDLHVAIQDAMGWRDCHLHEFEVADASPGQRVRVGIPDEEWPDERPTLPGWRIPIAPYLAHEGAAAIYRYDFGDGWEHTISFEGPGPAVTRGSRRPLCIGGERACPPEDVGGVPGFEEFLAAIRPTPGPETRLEAGDLLVLFGPHVAIDRALDVFEPGAGARAKA